MLCIIFKRMLQINLIVFSHAKNNRKIWLDLLDNLNKEYLISIFLPRNVMLILKFISY